MFTAEGGGVVDYTTGFTAGFTAGLRTGLLVDVNSADAAAMTWPGTALGTRARVASPSPTMAFVYDLERQEEDCPFKLIDLQVHP